MIDTERMAEYTKWLVWVGVGIGVLQIVLLIFQSLYSGRAANAAKASADVAERTLLVSQRGWAITSDFGISGLTPNSPATVSFRIVNAGTTPIVFTGADCLSRIDTDLPDTPNYEVQTVIPNPTGIFGPGQHATMTHLTRTITSTEFMELAAGTKTLFVWGRITYKDVFGREHPTGYLVMLPRDRSALQHVPSKPKYTYSD